MKPRTLVAFDRLDMLEWQLCERLARFNAYPPWLFTLRLASKLGDWPIWVLLIAAQPMLHGAAGINYLIQYSLTALVAIAIYRRIKTRLCRERPFITFHRRIACGEPARDRFSFPSGHTMHAVMFCLLAAHHTAWLLPLLTPLIVLIALSRIGLGLHYISDVFAGAPWAWALRT